MSDHVHIEQETITIRPQARRVVEGKNEIIASTFSPFGVYAGMQALADGGTAADAAITVALMDIAVNLGAVVSYAGVAQFLYYEADTGRVHSLDANWNSYRGETNPLTIPDSDLTEFGGRASTDAGGGQGRKTLVPGFMAGMEAIHSRFGKLEFADLFVPSIWFAENGVPVSNNVAAYFRNREKYLIRTPEGRAFAHPDGTELPQAGRHYVQPELAATLRAVARDGAAYMYTGEWGREYVDRVRAEGGKATMEDMAAYAPIWDEPLSIPFADGVAFAPGETNPAGCQVLLALNLLAASGVSSHGYWEDPETFMTYADILRYVIVGKDSFTAHRFESEQGFASECTERLKRDYAVTVLPRLRELADRTFFGRPGSLRGRRCRWTPA